MASFNTLLTSQGEEIVKLFFAFNNIKMSEGKKRLEYVSRKLGLKPEQLIIATGFNSHFRKLPELLPLLSCANIDELINERNRLFINDIYKKLTLKNILAVYNAVKDDASSLQVMQYLMAKRLETIESRIEETVESITIEKYKIEMQVIYSDGIAGIDFAERRLDKLDSGFRALLNEVAIIADSKLIPVGDIFFRDTILPEEKRKLLSKGLIPNDLIIARLEDKRISQRERKLLNEYFKNMKQNNAGDN